MDFVSLGVSAPFYILHKGEKLSLQVGTVKSKTDPKPQFQTQTPGVFTGINTSPNVIDVIVNVNGTETPFNNLPFNAETAQYNNGQTLVSCSREAMLQAVDGMIQTSKKALEQVDYHKNVLKEGEKMLETLNPTYAENKRNARTIKDLQERADAQDKKLDSIASQNQQILNFLQELNGGSAPRPKQS